MAILALLTVPCPKKKKLRSGSNLNLENHQFSPIMMIGAQRSL